MRKGLFTGYSLPKVPRLVRPGQTKVIGQPYTIKDFSGGWDAVTNELSMSRRNSRIMQNVYSASDGSVAVRYGCKLFADLADVGMGEIIGMEYFATFICAVDSTGKVALVEGDGTISVVWDQQIATQRGVQPWSTADYVSFAQMRNQLVICNGVNKALSVQTNKTCNYLVDLGTLQNTRVPIAKYVFAHQRYLIMGGDPNFPDRLYIGSRDTVGTFFGDPPPNDAVNLDLASYVSGDPTITGINAFREFLVVSFPNSCLVAKLGTYSGSQHQPQFDDPLQEIGCVAHKTMAFLGDDLFLLDIAGVQSLSRVFVTNKLEPISMSDNIQPELVNAINRVPIFTDNATSPFGIYHHNQNLYYLFVPNNANADSVTESRAFVFQYVPEKKVQAWADFRGWNWRSVCKSLLHDMFTSRGSKIFLHGRDELPIYGDYVGDEETWTDNTAFTDGHGLSPAVDTDTKGIPIDFVWELPWTDFGIRMLVKELKYVQVDSSGTGQFTIYGFVDNLYKARDIGEEWNDETLFSDGLGWIRQFPLLQPNISMQLIGGDADGYGLAPYGDSPYGGGRMSSDERLYEFPQTGKIHKLRIEGSTNAPLSFKSLSIVFAKGLFGR